MLVSKELSTRQVHILKSGCHRKGHVMRTALGLAFQMGAGLLFVSFLVCPTTAQVMDAGWAQPVKISVIDPADGNAGRAPVVADRNGNFHAVWSERRTSDGRVFFLYAVFDGDLWSAPVLIYTSPVGSRVGPLNLSIDHYNHLHLVWTEAATAYTIGPWPAVAPIFHTTVPADEARRAESWPTPRVIMATAFYVSHGVDLAGTHHMLYSDAYSSSPGIYYIRSTDGGHTWTPPVKVDNGGPPDSTPYYSQLRLDDFLGAHALWEYKQGWQTVAVAYSQSLDGGFSWSPPVILDQAGNDLSEIQYGHPQMAIHGDEVHAIWAGGGFANVGRRHRYSLDRGKTWTSVQQLFGNLHGFIDAEAWFADSYGRIHLFDLFRFPQGIYHATWHGNWSDATLIYMNQETPSDPIGDRIFLERLNAAASKRQLIATFITDGTPTLLYSMHTLLPPIVSVSAASYAADRPLAPGSIVAGFGNDLAPSVGIPSVWPPPLELQDTSVEVLDSAGTVFSAPLFYVSPEQVNYLLPEHIATGLARVRIRRPDGLAAVGTVQIANVSPAIFTVNAQGAGAPVGTYVRVAPGNSQSEGLLFDLETLEPVPLDIASSQGEVSLALFGTGFRRFQSQVTATIGEVTVPVTAVQQHAAVPGLDIIYLGPLPTSLAGRGLVQITLAADNVPSNTCVIRIK